MVGEVKIDFTERMNKFSFGANMVGLKGASSRKGFVNYPHIAHKSAKEASNLSMLLKESSPELLVVTALSRASEEIAKITDANLLTLTGE